MGGGRVRSSVPTLLSLALLQATSVLAADYSGPGDLYVNTDVTYGKVEFASTIGNNSLVTVAESGSLSADNVNIYADDSDTTGWVNGIWVRGPGSVQVTEGTTIILDSTATSPAGQYQRIGVYPKKTRLLQKNIESFRLYVDCELMLRPPHYPRSRSENRSVLTMSTGSPWAL